MTQHPHQKHRQQGSIDQRADFIDRFDDGLGYIPHVKGKCQANHPPAYGEQFGQQYFGSVGKFSFHKPTDKVLHAQRTEGV